MRETADRVRAVIASYSEVEPASLNDGTSFTEDLGMDSLSVMELIISFEEEFFIELDQASVNSVASVGDAIKAIESAVAKRQ